MFLVLLQSIGDAVAVAAGSPVSSHVINGVLIYVMLDVRSRISRIEDTLMIPRKHSK